MSPSHWPIKAGAKDVSGSNSDPRTDVSDEVSVWIAAKPWRNRLAGFRSPASLSTPRWRPKLASLFEVVALRQLALPEVATHHRVAVLARGISEVLAGHANHAALLVPKISVALVVQNKYS